MLDFLSFVYLENHQQLILISLNKTINPGIPKNTAAYNYGLISGESKYKIRM